MTSEWKQKKQENTNDDRKGKGEETFTRGRHFSVVAF